MHGLREVEAVHPDADLLDELPGLIELEQPRAGLVERAVGAQGGMCGACPRVHEDMALRIRGHPGRFAQVNVVGELQQIRIGIKWNVGHSRLGEQRCAKRESRCRDERGKQGPRGLRVHHRPPLPLELVDCGRRMIFCARQLVISDRNSSLGLRQSIPCTVLNSLSALPPLPNLPMIVPSSSIL